MKDKNKNKVFKATPLTFEEKMEKMMQGQKSQIDSLVSMMQMQYEMIKNLQEGKSLVWTHCGHVENKIESRPMPPIEVSELEASSKQNNPLIDKILQMKDESKLIQIYIV